MKRDSGPRARTTGGAIVQTSAQTTQRRRMTVSVCVTRMPRPKHVGHNGPARKAGVDGGSSDGFTGAPIDLGERDHTKGNRAVKIACS